MSPNTNS